MAANPNTTPTPETPHADDEPAPVSLKEAGDIAWDIETDLNRLRDLVKAVDMMAEGVGDHSAMDALQQVTNHMAELGASIEARRDKVARSIRHHLDADKRTERPVPTRVAEDRPLRPVDAPEWEAKAMTVPQAYKVACNMEDDLASIRHLAHAVNVFACSDGGLDGKNDATALQQLALEIVKHAKAVEDLRGHLFHGLHPSHAEVRS